MTETVLTKRQQQILEFIDLEIRDRGYPPSVREIGEAVEPRRRIGTPKPRMARHYNVKRLGQTIHIGRPIACSAGTVQKQQHGSLPSP